ncbi:hypothetical protein [Streptomyces sp. CMB-StM0423]|uniref:hypothetical protein n=1 Tax=Streptomyces sp. CMB-StM0423 TaxID=2059884 RepID=UPI000C6FD545|nr:hypothetical protein CXR04_13880 [Streptomyces sp. CMB-StM0423]
MHMGEGVEWGLHSCLTLAWLRDAGPVPIRRLAVWFDLPQEYLKKRLQALARATPQETALVVGLNASAIYTGIGLGTLLGGVLLPLGTAEAATAGAALAVAAGAWPAGTRRYG